ncbi:MAG: DNA mismatch repair endonuclease MutL [Hydrogenibacillus sp.]|nr:DNA mismatch repair endonuclease MutL [Hydrogenibacillus sp.]
MGKIRLLAPEIANQIAAGEVVERPASVVKELVENALDAGARSVTVDVWEAGLKRMTVVDDGEGIEPEDLPRAFERHATSKIARARDLWRIQTLGFRGEALPSIASVARVTIRSRPRSASGAYALTVEGGALGVAEVTEGGFGTAVEVRDLFFNTPARLKFLKSLKTEERHIEDTVVREALARPDVAFRLALDGRERLWTTGDGQLLNTVLQLFGADIAEALIPFEDQAGEVSAHGLIGRPETARRHKPMYFFVNGRAVRAPLLQKVVLDAYDTRLMRGVYPYVFVFLSMDPALVDVNVHPAKWEVRFSEEQAVFALVRRAVLRALERVRLIPAVPAPSRTSERPAHQAAAEHPAKATDSSVPTHPSEPGKPPVTGHPTKAASLPALKIPSAPEGFRVGAHPRPFDTPSKTADRLFDPSERYVAKTHRVSKPQETHVPYDRRAQDGIRQATEALLRTFTPPEATDSLFAPERFSDPGAFPKLVPIVQLFDSYILAEGEDGLYVVDQHAAEERIRYERLIDEARRQTSADTVLLLPPIPLPLSTVEAERLLDVRQALQALGLRLERASGGTVELHELPIWMDKAVAHELALAVAGGAEPTLETLVRLQDEALKTKACKGAVKANERLSAASMQQLLEALSKAQKPYTCPHGRPVIVQLMPETVAAWFKRR